MKLTVKELQEKSYSFLFDGQGITGTIRVGMIGNCAFSIDDLSGTAFATISSNLGKPITSVSPSSSLLQLYELTFCPKSVTSLNPRLC